MSTPILFMGEALSEFTAVSEVPLWKITAESKPASASVDPVPTKIFFLYTLLSLSGNLGRLTRVRLQQPQEQRYTVLQVHAGSVRVSIIH